MYPVYCRLAAGTRPKTNVMTLGFRTLTKKLFPMAHDPPMAVADVTPAIDQTPPWDSRIGPPESPEQTLLLLVADCVSSDVDVTAEIAVIPARRIVPKPRSSCPQPAITASSPVRASRLTSRRRGARLMSWVVMTMPTSSDGWKRKDSAAISSPVPGQILTSAVSSDRQCAAVRTARGAMTVPEQAPMGTWLASRRFTSTTDEFACEQAVP